MTLISALEDLQENTIHSILGCLRKLEYVAGLRSRAGAYTHWGFVRVHGEGTAEKALAQAHRALLFQKCFHPLQNLEERGTIQSRRGLGETSKARFLARESPGGSPRVQSGIGAPS
jgi:hypothetical protein